MVRVIPSNQLRWRPLEPEASIPGSILQHADLIIVAGLVGLLLTGRLASLVAALRRYARFRSLGSQWLLRLCNLVEGDDARWGLVREKELGRTLPILTHLAVCNADQPAPG